MADQIERAAVEAAEAAGGAIINMVNESNITDRQTLEDLDALADDGGRAIVILSGLLMMGFLAGHLLHSKKVTWLPESLVVVALGAVLGFVLPSGETSVSRWAIERITIQEYGIVNEIILNFILLPMIIFEAGWSMHHRNFISQFPYILLFAIFGTLISMGVVTGLILATSGYHGVSHPRVAMAYAALISAVDPVATLATYAHLNVDPLLNTMVFGESVINDAVAIVLFKTLNDMPDNAFEELSFPQLSGQLAGGVVFLLSCSLGVGMLLAALYCLILRVTNLGKSKQLSALFIAASCFFTYNFTESICHMSGIIAVLFCGMVMGGFATPHLSEEGTMLTSFLLKQMAFIGDMVVFLFVGIAVVYVSPNGAYLGLWVMSFCLLGRGIATVPLAMLTNCIKNTALRKRPEKHRHLLKWRHIFMMWHAGLRGGIALVLTLELGDWVDSLDGPETKDSLRNSTLIVIVAFLLLFGGTTEMLLTALKIPMRGMGRIEHVDDGKAVRMYSKVSDVANCILVGGAPQCQEASMPVLFDVLSEAVHAEETGDGLSRFTSSRSDISYSERYELFGTNDPTHSAEVGQDRRRRATGAINSSVSAIGRRTEPESDDEDSVSSSGSCSSLTSNERGKTARF